LPQFFFTNFCQEDELAQMMTSCALFVVLELV